MAIALGSHAVNHTTSAATSLSTSGVSTTASGSTFVIGVRGGGGNLTGVTDNKSNSYTQIGTTQIFNSYTSLWYCSNGNGGAGHTATANYSASGTHIIFFAEITGAAASSFDQYAEEGEGSGQPHAVTTGTLSQADELVISLYGNGSTVTNEVYVCSTGYTDIDQVGDATDGSPLGALAYKIVASTSAVTASWVDTVYGGSGHELITATFKEGTASASPKRALLLGVG